MGKIIQEYSNGEYRYSCISKYRPGEEVEEEENRRASYTYNSFSLYYVVADTYAIISLLNQPISSRMTALAPFSNQTFFPQKVSTTFKPPRHVGGTKKQ